MAKEFDLCSKEYSKFRPEYPPELFEWISGITPCRNVVVDCGTGNGQAALGLINFFDQVIGIDASLNQLRNAAKHQKIQYCCMQAENIGLPNNSVDLIVSASAVHWFNLDTFYSECKRLLKPQGRIVVWTYTWPLTHNLAINEQLIHAKKMLANYWTESSLLHLNRYETLSFPFIHMKSPEFGFNVDWDLDQVLNFFSTWACISEYVKKINNNFIFELRENLKACWPSDKCVRFIFPLYLKSGFSD